MRPWLLLASLVVLTCVVTAKHGSISKDLFESDVSDDEPTLPEVKQGERLNVCASKKCHRGEMCSINEGGDAECVCVPDCGRFHGQGDRYKVCSNKNETFETSCDLDREHCLCKRGDETCQHPGVKKIQLEYYGECQDMAPCSNGSMAQFPGRLVDWLFVVMETMAQRADIGEYNTLLEEAKEDSNHTYAAIWGFCDLDKDPQDRFVSRRELQYTVRTLRVMEHCLVPFLDDCDEDDNRRITLPEWGECLGLPHDKITDKCNRIHEKRGKKNNNKRR